MISRVFQARLAELDTVMSWVRETLIESSMPKASAKKFELAIEEAVINIIEHAYPNLSGVIEIAYNADAGKGEIQYTLRDQGVPFNPLNSEYEADITSELHERKIGGLGIHFILQMADRIDYRREGESNILVLTKSFS